MVSTLWKACSEGNLENVHELLKEASSVDIETKGASARLSNCWFNLCAVALDRSMVVLTRFARKIILVSRLSSKPSKMDTLR